jgi:simple sugar transport system ATP-binding protein
VTAPGRDRLLLQARGLTKRFGQFVAIEDIDLDLEYGKTLGLVGDNGAGKSTVIKILSGFHQPDRGEITFQGRPIAMASPKQARKLGIETVYQDLALVDELSVARNFFLGAELKKRYGPVSLLDLGAMVERTEDYIADLGITRLASAERDVAFLSGGERQAIAIARAMYFGAKLIILDEPTSALSVKEARRVLEYVRAANEREITVLIISHNIRYILPVVDEIAVMYHGRIVASYDHNSCDADVIEELIMSGPEGLSDE